MGTKFKGTKREVKSLNAYIKLMRATDSVASQISNQLRKIHELTISQFGVLESLFHLGPMYQSELSQKLLKSGGNIVVVVDNLTKKGLVRRQRSEEDRRYITIHLTDEGEEFIRKIFPIHMKIIVNVMSYLTDDELDELGRLSKKLGCKSIE